MDPCNTKKSMSLLVEYASLRQTLKPLFCRYDLNHFNTTSLILNFLSRTFKSTWWSTVLNAALRSRRIKTDTDCLSMAQSRSFIILSNAVSQLWPGLYCTLEFCSDMNYHCGWQIDPAHIFLFNLDIKVRLLIQVYSYCLLLDHSISSLRVLTQPFPVIIKLPILHCQVYYICNCCNEVI